MLPISHIGITLGAVTCLSAVVDKDLRSRFSLFRWFGGIIRRMDIRVLVIGSLLPDIIDKPVGIYLLSDSIGNGRIYTHTLLFLLLVAAGGWILQRLTGRIWLLVLALGIFFHLVLDEIWRSPETLFWPLLGLEFPDADIYEWLSNIWEAYLTRPSIWIAESVGLLVILLFLFYLIKERKFNRFLRSGRIE